MGRKHKHKHYHKHYSKHFETKFDENRCAFCGKDFGGLPHRCKYCGESHCSSHLLPEDHKCMGLNQPKNFTFFKKEEKSHYPTYHSPAYTPHKEHGNSWHSTPRRHSFRLPRMRINRFFTALLLAILTYFLARYFINNSLFLWLEAGAWIYFSFIIYRRAFRWANRVSMADDLAFWGLRILGGAVFIVGIYISFFTLLASAFTKNSASMSIPIFSLLAGLVLLGLFIAFRTNRRHNVVGIWGA